MNEVYADNGATDAESEKRIYEKSQKWMELRSADENFALEQIISMTSSTNQAPFDRITTDKIGFGKNGPHKPGITVIESVWTDMMTIQNYLVYDIGIFFCFNCRKEEYRLNIMPA